MSTRTTCISTCMQTVTSKVINIIITMTSHGRHVCIARLHFSALLFLMLWIMLRMTAG